MLETTLYEFNNAINGNLSNLDYIQKNTLKNQDIAKIHSLVKGEDFTNKIEFSTEKIYPNNINSSEYEKAQIMNIKRMNEAKNNHSELIGLISTSIQPFMDDILCTVNEIYNNNSSDIDLIDIEKFYKYSLIMGSQESKVCTLFIQEINNLSKLLLEKEKEIAKLNLKASKFSIEKYFFCLKQICQSLDNNKNKMEDNLSNTSTTTTSQNSININTKNENGNSISPSGALDFFSIENKKAMENLLHTDVLNRECLTCLEELVEQMDKDREFYSSQVNFLSAEVDQRNAILDEYQNRENYFFKQYFPELLERVERKYENELALYKNTMATHYGKVEAMASEFNHHIVNASFKNGDDVLRGSGFETTESSIQQECRLHEIIGEKEEKEKELYKVINRLKQEQESQSQNLKKVNQELDEVKSQLKCKEQEILEKEKSYQEEISRYQRRSKAQAELAQTIKNNIKNQQSEYNKKVNELQQALDSRSKIVDFVQNKLKIRENELKIVNIRYTNNERQMNIEREQYKREVNNLKSEIEKNLEDIDELECELDTQEEELNKEYADEIGRLEKEHDLQLSKLWSIIDQRETTINNMESSMDELKQKNETLEKEVNEKKEEIEKMKNEKDKLENQFQEEKEALTHNLPNLDQYQQLEKAKYDLENQCQDLAKQRDESKDFADLCVKEKVTLETLCETLKKGQSDLELENTQMKEEMKELKTQIKVVKDEKLKLETQFQEIKKEKSILETKFKAMEDEKSDLESKCKQVEDEKEALKNNYITLEEKNKELNDQVDKVREENEYTKNQYEKIEKERMDFYKQIESKKESLENSYNQLKIEKETIHMTCKQLKNEKREVQTKQEEKKAKFKKLKNEHKEKMNEFYQLKTKYKEVIKEMKLLQYEYSLLKKKYFNNALQGNKDFLSQYKNSIVVNNCTSVELAKTDYKFVPIENYNELKSEVDTLLLSLIEQKKKKNNLKQKLSHQTDKNRDLIEQIKKERLQSKEEMAKLKQTCVKQNGKIKAILKQVKEGLITAEHLDFERIVKKMKSERQSMNSEFERFKKITSNLSNPPSLKPKEATMIMSIPKPDHENKHVVMNNNDENHKVTIFTSQNLDEKKYKNGKNDDLQIKPLEKNEQKNIDLSDQSTEKKIRLQKDIERVTLMLNNKINLPEKRYKNNENKIIEKENNQQQQQKNHSESNENLEMNLEKKVLKEMNLEKNEDSPKDLNKNSLEDIKKDNEKEEKEKENDTDINKEKKNDFKTTENKINKSKIQENESIDMSSSKIIMNNVIHKKVDEVSVNKESFFVKQGHMETVSFLKNNTKNDLEDEKTKNSDKLSVVDISIQTNNQNCRNDSFDRKENKEIKAKLVIDNKRKSLLKKKGMDEINITLNHDTKINSNFSNNHHKQLSDTFKACLAKSNNTENDLIVNDNAMVIVDNNKKNIHDQNQLERLDLVKENKNLSSREVQIDNAVKKDEDEFKKQLMSGISNNDFLKHIPSEFNENKKINCNDFIHQKTSTSSFSYYMSNYKKDVKHSSVNDESDESITDIYIQDEELPKMEMNNLNPRLKMFNHFNNKTSSFTQGNINNLRKSNLKISKDKSLVQHQHFKNIDPIRENKTTLGPTILPPTLNFDNKQNLEKEEVQNIFGSNHPLFNSTKDGDNTNSNENKINITSTFKTLINTTTTEETEPKTKILNSPSKLRRMPHFDSTKMISLPAKASVNPISNPPFNNGKLWQTSDNLCNQQ